VAAKLARTSVQQPSDASSRFRVEQSTEASDECCTQGLGYVDVEPQCGRLVVFDSQRTLHEVLPVYRHRYAITAWFYA